MKKKEKLLDIEVTIKNKDGKTQSGIYQISKKVWDKNMKISGKCKCGKKITIKYNKGDIASKTCECGQISYAPYISKTFKIIKWKNQHL